MQRELDKVNQDYERLTEMMKNNINKVITETVNENYAYQGQQDDDIRKKPTKGYKYE